MAVNFGVPYMGSKNGIALELIKQLPSGRTFYDLFAGGCAMTHVAMLSGKYERFVINDMDWRGITLFRDGIAGKYADERRVITREEFFLRKDNDPYLALCWSYGNNQTEYLWNQTIEKVKVSACRMVMADTWQERRLLYRDFIRELLSLMKACGIDGDTTKYNEFVDDGMQALQGLECLQRVERLQGLQQLRSMRSLGLDADMRDGTENCLKLSVKSYDEVEIDPDGAVVYCDPPYRGTHEYSIAGFDYDKFYNWLATREFPVFVSEYNMPEDEFEEVWCISKRQLFSSVQKSKRTWERLFVHRKWVENGTVRINSVRR